MQGDYRWRAKERLNKQKEKTTRSTRSKRATEQEVIEPMEEISIDPPIISNFENYPVNEQEDKRIEVEQEELITSLKSPPVEEPKAWRKIVESLEGETQNKCRK